MIFKEIIDHLLLNRKCRCAFWEDGDYISFQTEDEHLKWDDGQSFNLTKIDLNTNCWEIVEKKVTISETDFDKAIRKAEARMRGRSGEVTTFWLDGILKLKKELGL